MKCLQLAIGLILVAVLGNAQAFFAKNLMADLKAFKPALQPIKEKLLNDINGLKTAVWPLIEKIQNDLKNLKPEVPTEEKPQEDLKDPKPEVQPIKEKPQDGDVKVGFGSESEGVAMMYWDGEWGTICDQGGFNPEGWASVFCQQLGYEAAEDIVFVRDLENGDKILKKLNPLKLAFEKPNCSPRDGVSLSECAHNQVNDQDDDFCQLGHEQDCWVTCKEGTKPEQPEEGSVRIVNGDDTHALEGRAEMFVNGSWGTICDARGLGRAGWPTVFCKQYLEITDDDYQAEIAMQIRDVKDTPKAPKDMPISFQMPECFPKDASNMMECGINHKNELQACGRIKKNDKVNYKGHQWDVWVKC